MSTTKGQMSQSTQRVALYVQMCPINKPRLNNSDLENVKNKYSIYMYIYIIIMVCFVHHNKKDVEI